MDEILDLLLNASDMADAGDVADIANYLGDSFGELPDLDDISFRGQSSIDDIYDPKIETATSNYDRHIDYATQCLEHGDVASAELYLRNAHQDTTDLDYWTSRKNEAVLQDEKNQIFTDHINAQLDIIEKYRKK